MKGFFVSREAWIAIVEASVLGALAFGVAYVARFQWIEPAHMEPLCADVVRTANDWRCDARRFAIATFSDNRLGWSALGVAALAWALRQRTLSLAGLVLSTVGLLLYSSVWCAPAFWLSALARLRALRARETRNTETQ